MPFSDDSGAPITRCRDDPQHIHLIAGVQRLILLRTDLRRRLRDLLQLRYYCAASATISLPSPSTDSPVARAAAMTLGCQSTLPVSGPPTTAISVASASSPALRNPR